MVTVEDVRSYLNNLSSEHVSDDTIRIQIRLAENIVHNEKAASATQEQIEDAILAKAGELTYIAFCTEMERALGVLPPVVATHVENLRRISDLMLSYVKRGTVSPVTAWELSESLWEKGVIGDV